VAVEVVTSNDNGNVQLLLLLVMVVVVIVADVPVVDGVLHLLPLLLLLPFH